MDGRGQKKAVSASMLDIEEMVESDHAAKIIETEWKGVMRQRKKKRTAQRWSVKPIVV